MIGKRDVRATRDEDALAVCGLEVLDRRESGSWSVIESFGPAIKMILGGPGGVRLLRNNKAGGGAACHGEGFTGEEVCDKLVLFLLTAMVIEIEVLKEHAVRQNGKALAVRKRCLPWTYNVGSEAVTFWDSKRNESHCKRANGMPVNHGQ